MDYLKKSRIEEVLIAILGKGTVTSQLISRIEKILDAIRVNGSYDGIAMSEVEEILICILRGERFEKPTHSRIAAMLKVKANGGEYTELRKSRVEELIFEWINAVESATYTGTLPATLQTIAGYLESYKIYGNTVQDGTPTPENPIEPQECGEKTKNLFDISTATTGEYWINDNINTFTYHKGARCYFIPVSPHVTYTVTVFTGTLPSGTFVFRAAFTNTVPTSQSASVGETYLRRRIDSKGGDKHSTIVTNQNYKYLAIQASTIVQHDIMLNLGSTAPTEYIPYGYKLPLAVNGVEYPIYIDNEQLAKDEYVDSSTGKIYRRTKNLSPPEEEWVDEWIWGDGTIHPSTEIKTSPFIDVSTCETCIMEVFSAETEWAAAGYREMAFYAENKQYLGWIGGGGKRALTPNSSERLSEFPAGTVYVRISCSHGDQPFYPQLVSGYTPVHRFYPYRVPTDPPAPFPQIPTAAGTTAIDYNGSPKPEKVELTYQKTK